MQGNVTVDFIHRTEQGYDFRNKIVRGCSVATVCNNSRPAVFISLSHCLQPKSASLLLST